MDLLSEIIAIKKKRLTDAKKLLPLERLRDFAHQARPRSSFADALRNNTRVNIIAEFKRRSPSKGTINSEVDPVAIAKVYESAGAAAVSVLTEGDHFGGSLEDLRQIREAVRLPILRKDFIFDEYQVYESAFVGASALLLIVAALDDVTLATLREIAEDELGMDALVEVHTKQELDRALKCGARLIGVNNRDLRSFDVSIETSTLLARGAPRDVILVSESGLTPEAVRQLRVIGYRGFLIGEALMRAADPAKTLGAFLDEPSDIISPRDVRVKICGVTNLDDAQAAIDAGADLLGFNFYRASPRFIEPNAAADIISSLRLAQPAVLMIGVFVNEPIDDVLRVANEAGLNGIQLHGDESVEYSRRLKQLSPQRFVIKAIASNERSASEIPDNYPVDAIMVDASNGNLRGGTGHIADWSAAAEITRRVPRVFLAGGLSPENVAEAIAVVQPYAVDACSSLETLPGKKSAARMKEFVDAVRLSKLQAETKGLS